MADTETTTWTRATRAIYTELRRRGVAHRDAHSAAGTAWSAHPEASAMDPSLARDWSDAVTLYRDGRAVEAMDLADAVALVRREVDRG